MRNRSCVCLLEDFDHDEFLLRDSVICVGYHRLDVALYNLTGGAGERQNHDLDDRTFDAHAG